jgi:hypothetical protein
MRLLHLFQDSNEFIFLLIAGIIFTWFALISYLIRIFRQPFLCHSFSNWCLACWFSTCSIYTRILETISLIIGIIFVAIAITLLTKSQNCFIRQFAYCLFISGQTAFLFHLGSETNQILWVLIAQILFYVLVIFLSLIGSLF